MFMGSFWGRILLVDHRSWDPKRRCRFKVLLTYLVRKHSLQYQADLGLPNDMERIQFSDFEIECTDKRKTNNSSKSLSRNKPQRPDV